MQMRKRVGPSIIPARISPPKAGCFIFRNNAPKSFAPASKMTIAKNI